eukprot:1352481-Pyramimonas_sp.AAC.1
MVLRIRCSVGIRLQPNVGSVDDQLARVGHKPERSWGVQEVWLCSRGLYPRPSANGTGSPVASRSTVPVRV